MKSKDQESPKKHPGKRNTPDTSNVPAKPPLGEHTRRLRVLFLLLIVLFLALSVLLILCLCHALPWMSSQDCPVDGTGEVTFAPGAQLGQPVESDTVPHASPDTEAATVSVTEPDTAPVTKPASPETSAVEPPTDAPDTEPITEPATEPETETSGPQSGIWDGDDTTSGLLFTPLGDGTCMLSGIGQSTDPCLVIPAVSPEGWRVSRIADKAFYGCQSITAVYIPATVTYIGELAFASCTRLAYFTVDADNPAFMSSMGVLYSADASELLSYPPARSSASLDIPRTVQGIRDMAFYGVTMQLSVRYEGSWAEWQEVYIGYGNNVLFSCHLQYLGSTGKDDK